MINISGWALLQMRALLLTITDPPYANSKLRVVNFSFGLTGINSLAEVKQGEGRQDQA